MVSAAWEQQSRESLAEFLTQSAPYLVCSVVTITIFRKELSTNDEYRSASSRRKEERGAEDSVSRLVPS